MEFSNGGVSAARFSDSTDSATGGWPRRKGEGEGGLECSDFALICTNGCRN